MEVAQYDCLHFCPDDKRFRDRFGAILCNRKMHTQSYAQQT